MLLESAVVGIPLESAATNVVDVVVAGCVCWTVDSGAGDVKPVVTGGSERVFSTSGVRLAF